MYVEDSKKMESPMYYAQQTQGGCNARESVCAVSVWNLLNIQRKTPLASATNAATSIMSTMRECEYEGLHVRTWNK